MPADERCRESAAVGLHDVQIALERPGLERCLEPPEVVVDDRPDITRQDGSRCSLVLPVLGSDLVRERYEQLRVQPGREPAHRRGSDDLARGVDDDQHHARRAGVLALPVGHVVVEAARVHVLVPEDRADPLLVLRVEVGVQEAHRQGPDAFGLQIGEHGRHVRGRQGPQHAAVGRHALVQFVDIAITDNRGRRRVLQDVGIRAVPGHTQEAGTYIVPGHGRICDEADVVEFRDMVDALHRADHRFLH